MYIASNKCLPYNINQVQAVRNNEVKKCYVDSASWQVSQRPFGSSFKDTWYRLLTDIWYRLFSNFNLVNMVSNVCIFFHSAYSFHNLRGYLSEQSPPPSALTPAPVKKTVNANGPTGVDGWRAISSNMNIGTYERLAMTASLRGSYIIVREPMRGQDMRPVVRNAREITASTHH